MKESKWLGNLEKMVNAQYYVLVLAGCPDGFSTWSEATDMIRELVTSNTGVSVHTRVHSWFRLVEFFGFTPAGPFSINVPFPDFS